MNKQKLLDNLDLRIDACEKEMKRIADRMERAGNYSDLNYGEMYAATVGSLDAYLALKDAILEGQFDD